MGERNQNDADRGIEAVRESETEKAKAEARRALDAGATVGRGMTSPDSTEAPLSAETGEPDDRALGYGISDADREAARNADRDADRGSRRNANQNENRSNDRNDAGDFG